MPTHLFTPSLRHRQGLLSACAVLCGALAACGGSDDGRHAGTAAPDAARALTVDTSYGTQGHTVLPLGTAGTSTAAISATQLQPDGKLLLAGWRLTPPAGQADPPHQTSKVPTQAAVWRLNADGSPDTSFGQGGHVIIDLQGKNAVEHLRWTPEGIVLALSLSEPCTPTPQYNYQCLDASGVPVHPKAALVRLDAHSALDPRFGHDGVAEAPYGRPSALAVQPDGHILWLISTSHPRIGHWRWNLQRYTSSGTADTTFNQGQPLASQCESNGVALALLPDGRILASGDRAAVAYTNPAHSPGICLEAVRPDGQRDSGFANGQPLWLHAGANAVLNSMSVNHHGHITLTAHTRDAAGTCAFNASRLTATGQRALHFGSGGIARLPLTQMENNTCALSASLHTAQGHTVMIGTRRGPATQETVWTRLTPDGRPDDAFSPAGIYTTPEPGMAHLLQDAHGRWLRIDIRAGHASGDPTRARITRLMGESG